MTFHECDFRAELPEVSDMPGGLKGQVEGQFGRALSFQGQAAPGGIFLSVRGNDHGTVMQDQPGREGRRQVQQLFLAPACDRNPFRFPEQGVGRGAAPGRSDSSAGLMKA